MGEETKVPQIRFKGFSDPWEQRKLGELYELNNERNGRLLGHDTTLSVATMTYKSEGSGAADSSLENYKVLRLGDIAFEGHTNKTFRYGRFVLNDTGQGLMSPRFTCLRPIAKQHYSFWKYYINHEPLMRSVLANATKAGTMMNELVVRDFVKQEIKTPQLSEQKKIGTFFQHLDTLITLHQRKYDKLKILKKSMLEKMFPKDGADVPEVRFAGFTNPWEQRKLGDVSCEFRSGDFISAGEISKLGKYPVYGGNGLRGYTESYNHNGLFVLVGRQGALCGNVNIADGKAYFTEHAVAVQADQNNETGFLFYLLDTLKLGQYSGQSAQPGLAVSTLVEVRTKVPERAEQQKIGIFFQYLDSLITLHQRELEILKRIKTSCLEKMFV